jgi:ferredoxin
MTNAILSESDVATLVTELVGSSKQVVAPVRAGADWEHTEYARIERLEDAMIGGALPRHSLKEFFRPAQEERTPCAPQVVLGAPPCDAAGVERLDHVMAHDYHDELWAARRAATTIVTVACSGAERSCFCGAVGLGPDSTRGTDALLVPLDVAAGPPPSQRRTAEQLRHCVELFLLDTQPFPGAAELQRAAEPPRRPMRWAASAVTPKGEALLRGRGQPLNELDRARAGAFARVARESVASNLVALQLSRADGRLDADVEAQLAAADGGELVDPVTTTSARAAVERLPEWLARNFDHALWSPLAQRCRGCGNCASVCSTSPCFDVDQHDRSFARRPIREGPPPRRTQTERLRQRIMHKFSIYPRRFESVLCTGCGRCSRACQGGMNLPEILGQLVQLAAPEASGMPT